MKSTSISTHSRAVGEVLLVGAGPGDAELLTIKAVKALRKASVVLVDDLVSEDCLRYVKKSARVIYVGKRGGKDTSHPAPAPLPSQGVDGKASVFSARLRNYHEVRNASRVGCKSTPQHFIEQLMIREALAGERVVRLKGGDPLIFGRAGEEIAALKRAGVKVTVINGITSALAAANALSASLTHRDHAHGVVFVSAHLKDGSLALPFKALVDANMTLAFYMGIAHARELQAALLDAGLAPDTPAVFVERASTHDERVHCTSLQHLQHTLETNAVQSPAMLLIGKALAAEGSAYHTLSENPILKQIYA